MKTIHMLNYPRLQNGFHITGPQIKIWPKNNKLKPKEHTANNIKTIDSSRYDQNNKSQDTRERKTEATNTMEIRYKDNKTLMKQEKMIPKIPKQFHCKMNLITPTILLITCGRELSNLRMERLKD